MLVAMLEVIADDECVRLMRGKPVGRLGLTASALPVVLPINFVVIPCTSPDDHTIVFCTESGLKLDAARQGSVACLEVDEYDGFGHNGWSVLATGRLAEVTDPARMARMRELPLRPWATHAARHYVELPIELLSGRRIVSG
jgi:nitroimidazol reductase NimA-like FMN-containing flavoprotein (pyridoxamine 5'-phosphate oxidase superfamily)